MQPDLVELDIDGLRTSAFKSFEITSDLYNPSGAFRIELGYHPVVKEGMRVQIHINGMLEMTGSVDRIEEDADHESHSFVVIGRSLVGLIEDSYIVDWKTPPQTLTGACAKYLADIPYVKECRYVLEHPELDKGSQHHAMDVGDTVFRLLNEYAQNRGLLFWSKPDGTLVFGKAISGGKPTCWLNSSNIQHRRRFKDLSRMHSEIWVVSDGDSHHVTKVSNSLVPLRKPFVAAYNGPRDGIAKQAANYMRQEKMAGFGLDYVVAGFAQAGHNWAINTMCQVDDDLIGVQGCYVVRRRVFRRDRNGGSVTHLSLGPVLEDPFTAFAKKGRRLRGRVSRASR